MRFSIIKQAFVLFALLMAGQKAHAQFQLLDSRAGVDTMKVVERFSFHTTGVDWILQMPNVDIEFDFRGNSWGKWSIMLGGKISVPVWHNSKAFFVYDPQSIEVSGEKLPYYVNDNKEVHLEVRNYWRKKTSRLSTVFYWGIRGGYGKYDLKLGKYGNKGTAIFAGGSFGMIRQLYGYPSGNSLDLELGITVGAVYSDNTKYTRNTEKNYFEVVDVKGKRIVPFPVVNELRAGLIYRFGSFPISRKYRRRYDADAAYRNAYEDDLARRRQMRAEKHNADSLFNMVSKYYNQQYDSISKVVEMEEKAAALKAREQEKAILDAQNAARAEQNRLKKQAEAEEKRLKKEAEKAAQAAREEEEKAAAAARKENKEAE